MDFELDNALGETQTFREKRNIWVGPSATPYSVGPRGLLSRAEASYCPSRVITIVIEINNNFHALQNTCQCRFAFNLIQNAQIRRIKLKNISLEKARNSLAQKITHAN